ncbi:MAG: tol-pal system protein YbgF, partial [Notoacmeibacter sp.]
MRKFPSMIAGLILSIGATSAIAQMPVPALDVPVVKQNLIVPVQATDPRVGQLEEQLRAMNGRVEELNFLVLELQEMLRKQQKDNEFRFQELENGKGGAAPEQSGDAGGAIQPAQPQTDVAATTDPAAPVQQGAPEQNLGTVTFDASGNPIGGNAVAGADIPAGLGDGELFE